jgi:two-component system, NarL family, nitrate/nitrite response regulator NarL
MTQNSSVPRSSSGPVRVAVLSEDQLLRAALAGLLEQQGEIEVTDIGRAEVALWDPGADRGRAEGRLRELGAMSRPTLALVPDAGQAMAALGAGAKGVLLRDRVGPHLVSALRAVRGGLTVLDASIADRLVGPREPVEPPPAVGELTAREREVVQLLAEGLSNKEIAQRLDISEHTAKFHIGRILMKLDADSRTEAVVRAVRWGLVML